MSTIQIVLASLLWDAARAEERAPPVIGEVRRVLRATAQIMRDEAVARPTRHVVGICEGPVPIADAAEDDIPERRVVEHDMAKCSRAGRHSDPWAVLALIRVEADVGAPRGALSSVACWESGYSPGARGDWQDGQALAWGLMQLHPWAMAPSKCGLTSEGRDDADAAARCYWSRIEARLVDVIGAGCVEPLRVAEALVANAPRYSRWGCAARSEHARELARWGARP